MKRWLQRVAIALPVVVGLAGATLLVGAEFGERKMHRQIEVAVQPVAPRHDVAGIERGRYLFMSRGCAECHGADGAGHTVIADANGIHVDAPDITSRGATAHYADADWVRTIRHGVKPNREPVILMPSEDFARWTDADVAALVGFVRQLPPGGGAPARIEFPMLVKALYAAGLVHDAAETIDHTLPPAEPVPEAVTVAHGAYVANGCIGCHGATLSGGKVPGAPPDWPAAANLTPGDGSALVRYANADAFVAMLRTGLRPDGSAVSRVMPFASLKEMSDVDLRALYLHLKALPPRAVGRR